jgi:hypothetical protein
MFLVVVVLGALVVRWMRCKLTRRRRSAGEYDDIQTEARGEVLLYAERPKVREL